MTKIGRFCKEWDIGKKEILEFIALLSSLTMAYMVMWLSARMFV